MLPDLLCDESVDFRIVTHLLEQYKGDVKSVLKDFQGISDDDVLEIARKENRILLTEDKDFGELAYRLKSYHRGILLIRLQDISIQERINKIIDVLMHHAPKLASSFVVITKDKIRIRLIDA